MVNKAEEPDNLEQSEFSKEQKSFDASQFSKEPEEFDASQFIKKEPEKSDVDVSKFSPDLIDHLAIAANVGDSILKDPPVSFTTLLLAYLVYDNETSSWFKGSLAGLIKEGALRSSFLVKVEGYKHYIKAKDDTYSSDIIISAPLTSYATASAENLLEIATELKNRTNSDLLHTRHVMGAYIYGDIGTRHEKQLKDWGFDRPIWGTEFLGFIKTRFPDEYPVWEEIHQENYGKEAPPPSQQYKDDFLTSLSDHEVAEDKLGRKQLASVLADQLRSVYKDNQADFTTRDKKQKVRGAFMVHLHAPWGAGKSTFLKLLEKELEAQDLPWIVVNYNAWRHQHIEPPWWSLLDNVAKQTISQSGVLKKITFYLSERLMRFSIGKEVHILSFILLIFALNAFVWWGLPEYHTFKSIEAFAKGGSAILSFIGTVWGILFALSSTLYSAKSSERFVDETTDPMKKIQTMFRYILSAVNRPVAIFIDDADRCHAEFTVKLLEGIQALFRDNRIIYVVAADRRWLYSCFEQIYEPFNKSVMEPGRRLGYLFLEKAFQLSLSLPRISEETQKKYWRSLLKKKREEIQTEESLRIKAKERLGNLVGQNTLLGEIQNAEKEARKTDATDEDKKYVDILKIEAVEITRKAAAHKEVEHFLEPFAPLLEPNPRSMKRLINAFILQRAIAFRSSISYDDPETFLRQLALWTIITMRWPVLLEKILDRHPEVADLIIKGQPLGHNIEKEIDDDPSLVLLLKQSDLRKVFQGDIDGALVPLDSKAIKKFSCLRSSVTVCQGHG
jgi:hypothetical protein